MENENDIKITLISLFNLDFGVRYISSFLREKGYPTYIIFFNKLRCSPEFLGNDYFTARLINYNICQQKDLDLLIFLLKKLKPTIIGISVSSATMRTAKCITREIKKHFDAIVVWGGIHAIIAPEECIQNADIVCIGEGELSMLELAEKVRHNQPISRIKNLWIKKNNGVEKNEMRSLIENLDELPFPDFIDQDNKFLIDNGRLRNVSNIISSCQRGIYPIMTSRGCMFSCAFCCNSVFKEKYKRRGTYLRRRSVENVIAELKLAVRNRSCHSIRFWDDVFTYDLKWIGKFCFQYIKEIGKPFSCYVHPKYIDKDILIKLRHAGLSSINVGIESGSEKISAQVFSRVQSNQKFLSFAKFMKKLSITARYDLISDNPYESDQDQEITTDLLLKLPHPFQMQLYSLCWFPGTPLTKRALSDGTITPNDLEQYTSKSLNNFYMYFQLSKRKRDFFWNCIKAMAINRYFPKFWVRFCKKNRFFKKYPKALFLLAHNYLFLFTKIIIRWEKNRMVIMKQFPRNIGNSVIYDDSNKIGHNFVVGSARWLFFKPEIEYSFFPLKITDEYKKFCLQIRHQPRRDRFFRILMDVIPFEKRKKGLYYPPLWLIEFSIGCCYQNELYFDLSYSELFYSINGYRYKAKLLKNRISPVFDKGVYSARLRYADKPNVFIGNILFEV